MLIKSIINSLNIYCNVTSETTLNLTISWYFPSVHEVVFFHASSMASLNQQKILTIVFILKLIKKHDKNCE